jgi:hypothetical protein
MTTKVNLAADSRSSHDPLNILKALIRMEAQSPHYRRSDYLGERRLAAEVQECEGGHRSPHLNEIWRTRVCEWFYRVIDSHRANLSREIAFISSSIVDRFLAKTSVDAEFDQEQSKSFFQLVTLTSLYVGVKAFHHRIVARSSEIASQEDFLREDNDVLTIQSLTRLSTAGIQADDIRAMTRNILTTLSWHIRPIPPLLFAKYMISVVTAPNNSPRCTKRRRRRYSTAAAAGEERSDENSRQLLHDDLYDRSRFLCELSVCDYFFICYLSSSVALASVLVAIDQLNQDNNNNREILDQEEFLQSVLSVSGNDTHSTVIALLKERLQQIYNRSSETCTDQQQSRVTADVVVAVVDEEQAYSDGRTLRKQRRVVSSEDLTALWAQS